MNIAVFASGGGSNFLSLVEACRRDEVAGTVQVLVTNKKEAGALTHAQDLKIKSLVFPIKEYDSFTDWDLAITAELKKYNLDLIVLAGFLKKIGPALLKEFKGKIINTHPSLLPDFGGPGMYGRKVHAAVIASGNAETGITIHSVTENYDEGPILAQKKIVVLAEDTVESLEERLKKIENQFVVATVAQICCGEIQLC